MALFDGMKKIDGSRSSTALVKSGHFSPAEDWILDPEIAKKEELKSVFANGYLFKYEYGGVGMEDVVIAKGRVVGVSKSVKDFKTKQYKTTMTFPGMATNNNIIGVVPYNICKDEFQNDRFGGNQPSIITLDYINLPYLPGVEASTTYSVVGVADEESRISKGLNMPWGAVLGNGIVEGDYLKATPSGRMCKWKKGTDNPVDIVGQVLATDFNSEPWGWFKWMLKDESMKYDEDGFINRSGASNLPSDAGYPFDPEYAEGNNIFQQYQSKLITNPPGYPGLHDGSGNHEGYGRNDSLQKFEKANFFLGTETPATDIKVAQLVDINGENIKNLDKIVSLKLVKADNSEVILESDKYSVDYAKGIVFVPYAAAYGQSKIVVEYKYKFYGTPSYIDFKGVVGSLFILLKR